MLKVFTHSVEKMYLLNVLGSIQDIGGRKKAKITSPPLTLCFLFKQLCDFYDDICCFFHIIN